MVAEVAQVTDLVDLSQAVARIEARQEAHGDVLAEISASLSDVNNRTRDNEVCIARLQEQTNLRSAGLAGVSVVLSAIAAWLGMSR